VKKNNTNHGSKTVAHRLSDCTIAGEQKKDGPRAKNLKYSAAVGKRRDLFDKRRTTGRVHPQKKARDESKR